MPISHIMGRVILCSTLGVGGTAYFAARSDLSTLLDDMTLVRPTKLDLVPRIWEMLFQEVQSEVDRRWTDAAVARRLSRNHVSDVKRFVDRRGSRRAVGPVTITHEHGSGLEHARVAVLLGGIQLRKQIADRARERTCPITGSAVAFGNHR